MESKMTVFSKVLIDTTRPMLIYIFVGIYIIIGIIGIQNGQMTSIEFIKSIEPHVGMMIAFMFGERAALKRPDDTEINNNIRAIMEELNNIKNIQLNNTAQLNNNIETNTINTNYTNKVDNDPLHPKLI